MAERIVIVGAGPAGLATARSYREHGGAGSLTLLGEEAMLPYERPPLTKDFLRGELDVSELAIESEDWFDAHGVRVELDIRVRAIDPAAGSVSFDGGTLAADAIVLATGSEPVRAELPGIEHPDVVTMRTLYDSVRISERAGGGPPALVIGTGFIGCEIAASLAMRGIAVKLIGQESLPQLERLGRGAASRIAGWLEDIGVELIAGVEVAAVHDGHTVELREGARLEGSCVVLGMGARPRGELAAAAGLPTSDGAIVVEADMRCAVGEGAAVLAVGDVACARNAAAGRHLRVEHWGDALEHGKVAGRTLAGLDAQWRSVPGFWSTIGEQTLKYAAWGDGYEQERLSAHPRGGFTVWYTRAGVAVGVLTHECDSDYELGLELILGGEPAP